MVTNAPIEHLNDALKLDGDAKVDLWEIRLKSVDLTYRFWNGPTRTWQGQSYEGLAVQLGGESRNTDGSSSRPTLSVQNPANIFGAFAAEGYFDLAELIRKRVLQTHLLADVNIFQQNVWICARPLSVTNGMMQLELRSPTDMPSWKTPRRVFDSRDYPFVTL